MTITVRRSTCDRAIAIEERRDLLVKASMALTQLQDLAVMVADFEAVPTSWRDHIGARADLDIITAELVEQVKLLGGITRNRFGKIRS